VPEAKSEMRKSSNRAIAAPFVLLPLFIYNYY
jgi:hypothetical protein